MFAGKCAQLQKRFAALRPDTGHQPADLRNAAGVTPRLDHMKDPRGAQTRVLFQRLFDELHIRTGLPCGAFLTSAAELAGIDCGADRIVMQTQLSGDRADLPMLREI
jgi:hypothetical protein